MEDRLKRDGIISSYFKFGSRFLHCHAKRVALQIGMKKTYLLNFIALAIAFLVGGVMLPVVITNVHAEVNGAPKRYVVQVNYARADLEPQLNKLTAQGWKFVQAVPDNEGVDIIFSK